MILGAVYSLLTRSVALTDETTRSLELQTGARNLLENLVEDVNSAHVFMEPPGSTTASVAILKYLSPDAKDRPKLNPRPTFPFAETEGQTADVQPVLRTTYTFDEAKKEVTRVVEKATLSSADEETSRGFLTKLELKDTSKVYEKVVATSVAQFSVTHCGYTTSGEPVPVEELSEPKYQKTSFLLVRFKTVFDEGLYSTGTRRTPTVELATKIWSYKRLSDQVYREYFSSADEDARY